MTGVIVKVTHQHKSLLRTSAPEVVAVMTMPEAIKEITSVSSRPDLHTKDLSIKANTRVRMGNTVRIYTAAHDEEPELVLSQYACAPRNDWERVSASKVVKAGTHVI